MNRCWYNLELSLHQYVVTTSSFIRHVTNKQDKDQHIELELIAHGDGSLTSVVDWQQVYTSNVLVTICLLLFEQTHLRFRNVDSSQILEHIVSRLFGENRGQTLSLSLSLSRALTLTQFIEVLCICMTAMASGLRNTVT